MYLALLPIILAIIILIITLILSLFLINRKNYIDIFEKSEYASLWLRLIAATIDIILIPEITVEDEKTSKFENIKSKQIKDAVEKFLNKNAMKFAEEIFLAKKTHNGYLLNDIFINVGGLYIIILDNNSG